MLSDVLLKKLNIQNASVQGLHSGINETFLVKDRGNQPFIIKKRIEKKTEDYSPYAEMAWLADLSSHGFPCVQPYNVDNVLNEDGIVYLLYQYINGTEPDRNHLNNYFEAGKILKQLHKIASEITHNDVLTKRPVYDRYFVVEKFLPDIESFLLFSKKTKGILFDLAEKITSNFPTGQQFIHGDFHFGNLLETENVLKVLDFDECGFGSVYYDLGTMKLHTIANKNKEFWQSFLNGYKEDLDDSQLAYGAAARIFYLIASIPSRMDLAVISGNPDDLAKRYSDYIEEILSPF